MSERNDKDDEKYKENDYWTTTTKYNKMMSVMYIQVWLVRLYVPKCEMRVSVSLWKSEWTLYETLTCDTWVSEFEIYL